MRAAGRGVVTIEGHTDAVGSDADNQKLSEARAATAKPVASNTKPDGSETSPPAAR